MPQKLPEIYFWAVLKNFGQNWGRVVMNGESIIS